MGLLRSPPSPELHAELRNNNIIRNMFTFEFRICYNPCSQEAMSLTVY